MKKQFSLFSGIIILLLVSFFFLTSSFVTEKLNRPNLHKFPVFEAETIRQIKLDNSCFTTKKSIVILAHLGCQPAMVLLSDIQKRRDLFDYQIIVFLENTKYQVAQFNGDSNNVWNQTRRHFDLSPIYENIVAECAEEKVKYLNGEILIGSQCREMARKLKSKSSPTIFFVNEMGEIERKVNGYPIDNVLESRVKSFLKK